MKIKSSFIIKSKIVKYDKIVNLIWLESDKWWDIWDKMVMSWEWNWKYYRFSTYILDIKSSSLDIQDHIIYLLKRVKLYEDKIAKLSKMKGINIELYITIEEKQDLSSIHIDNKYLLKISNMWINLDIDIFS